MILNNTQANIFKVNGGIADNFANRPAASGSFYIFYSIDTQEIYYDNGAWILIGSGGGGGGVNIYNSDGTLTGNRTLSGANNDLNFADLNIFKTSVGGNDIGLNIDFATQTYQLGDFNAINNGNFIKVIDQLSIIDLTTGIIPGQEINFLINSTNQYIKTRYQGNDIGLNLDFANSEYFLGNYSGNVNSHIEIISNQTFIGNNSTNLKIDNVNDEIVSKVNGSDNGIFLGSAGTYRFGQFNFGNSIFLELDDTSQTIKTQYQNNDIGLKLDFANTTYQFGQITGGNTTFLNINDTIQQFSVFNQLQSKGIFLDFQSNRYFYGIYNGLNQTYIEVDASQQRIITKGTTPGQPRGLDLLPNSSQYYFGNSSDLNRTYIQVNDTVQNIITSNQGLVKGLDINFGAKTFRFGQLNGGNSTYLDINDLSNRITVGSITGLSIDLNFPIKVYSFGNLGGGNQTFFSIADLAPHPIQFNGANVTSGTAGGASGQHLNVRINNVNYKIELKNP